VNSIWLWDHFVPLYGAADGAHFESWSLLAAMAVETERAHIGVLVTGNPYRNPDLLADMARTIDHLSEGRVYLGIGAGWLERDHAAYGYRFGTTEERLAGLATSLPRIRARLDALVPGPAGDLPLLVGGGGERVTLRLVAEHADAWNTFGPVERFRHKNAVLDEHCAAVGRHPGEIERTVLLGGVAEIDQVDAYADAGATHFILAVGAPFDLSPVRRLLEATHG